jgi:hypothetical protein
VSGQTTSVFAVFKVPGLFGSPRGYELDGQGSIPGRGRNFFVLCSVEMGSGVHSVSHPIPSGGSSSGGKAAGASISRAKSPL